MSWAFLLPLLLKALPFIAALVGLLGYSKYKERVWAKKEIAKRDAADRRVRDIADEIADDIGALTPLQRREMLSKKYAKK